MRVTHFILNTYTFAWRIHDILLHMEGSLYSHIWNLQRNACGTSLEKHLKQQLWLIFDLPVIPPILSPQNILCDANGSSECRLREAISDRFTNGIAGKCCR